MDAYLDGASAWLMLNVLLGCNLWLGLLFEIKFHRLYFLVTSSGFVGRIFQGSDLGLGVPRQFHLLDLKEVPHISVCLCSFLIFCCGLCLGCLTDHPALYPDVNKAERKKIHIKNGRQTGMCKVAPSLFTP